MRKILYAIVCVLLFFAACTPQVDYSQFETVEIYTAMSAGNVNVKDTLWSGSKADEIGDLVKAECPEELPGSFRRVVVRGTGSQLVLYTDPAKNELYCSLYKPDESRVTSLPATDSPVEGVIMTVNGVDVTAARVQQELNALPANVPKDEAALGQAINRVLNSELIRQEGLKLTLTEEDYSGAREVVLTRAGLTEESLAVELEAGNIDQTVLDQLIDEQARTDKLLEERILLDEIDVAEGDLQQFYLNNPNQFLQSESAVMRQIVVASGDRTAEQLQSRSQAVANFLQEGDFCEGVRRFSDAEEGIDQCGTYIAPRGVLNPDLEYAAFSTPVNQTTVVQTETGVHFVQTLQVIPAQVVPYSQASGQLRNTVVNNVFQQRLNLYLSMLRGDAEVTTYLG